MSKGETILRIVPPLNRSGPPVHEQLDGIAADYSGAVPVQMDNAEGFVMVNGTHNHHIVVDIADDSGECDVAAA